SRALPPLRGVACLTVVAVEHPQLRAHLSSSVVLLVDRVDAVSGQRYVEGDVVLEGLAVDADIPRVREGHGSGPRTRRILVRVGDPEEQAGAAPHADYARSERRGTRAREHAAAVRLVAEVR